MSAKMERRLIAGVLCSYYFFYDQSHRLLADQKNGSWTNYVWFAGELVAITRGGSVDDIDDDQLGRPEIITSGSKNIVWQNNNMPFSYADSPENQVPPINNAIDFFVGLPGQYYDEESGYWYNINRYYVAYLGRYLQLDPIGNAGGLNPYAYAGKNPVSRIDPLCLDYFGFTGMTRQQTATVRRVDKG